MKPDVKLSGTSGNVFSIIAKVAEALRRNNQPEQSEEFVRKTDDCESYDAALRLAMKYCNVN